MPSRTRLRAALCAAGLVVLLAGCSSGKPRKTVYPVQGRLTHQGKPMAGAQVTFGPANEIDPRALHSFGKADKNGRYQLTTYEYLDGAPAGECVVAIVWPERSKKAKDGEEPDESEERLADRLKGAYAHTATTTLKATVREQSNEINFDLP